MVLSKPPFGTFTFKSVRYYLCPFFSSVLHCDYHHGDIWMVVYFPITIETCWWPSSNNLDNQYNHAWFGVCSSNPSWAWGKSLYTPLDCYPHYWSHGIAHVVQAAESQTRLATADRMLDNTGSLDSGGVWLWGIRLKCGFGMKLMWVRDWGWSTIWLICLMDDIFASFLSSCLSCFV